MIDNFDSEYYENASLKRYFNFNDALFEFHKLFNLQDKDERSIAIIGGTFLEMALENILREFFPDDCKDVDQLFKQSTLNNFNNKINLCFCLGLIDKVIKEDLNLVRQIRNKFAHDLYITFDNNKIKSWSNDLKFHRISMLMNPPEEATELEIFKVGVNQLITHLHGCISLAKLEKRCIKNDLSKFLK